MYTAAPASGAAPFFRSRTRSLRASGTPAAVPEYWPKLGRMSSRTTPLCVSTFGPFDPSPGYGPAVSSGISLGEALVLLGEPEVVDGVVEVVVADVEVVDPLQAAANAASPPPPRTASARRRLSSFMRTAHHPSPGWS